MVETDTFPTPGGLAAKVPAANEIDPEWPLDNLRANIRFALISVPRRSIRRS